MSQHRAWEPHKGFISISHCYHVAPPHTLFSVFFFFVFSLQLAGISYPGILLKLLSPLNLPSRSPPPSPAFAPYLYPKCPFCPLGPGDLSQDSTTGFPLFGNGSLGHRQKESELGRIMLFMGRYYNPALELPKGRSRSRASSTPLQGLTLCPSPSRGPKPICLIALSTSSTSP